MRVWRLLLLCSLFIIPFTVIAQSEQSYTFIDGSTITFPDSFNIYNETTDELFIRNSTIDMYIFTMYTYTQRNNDIETLPQALQWYFDEYDTNGDIAFNQRDTQNINIFGREALRFDTQFARDNSSVERIVIALRVGDNDTIAVISTIPVGGDIVNDEELMLQVIRSLDTVDVGDLAISLGETIELGDGYILQYPADAYTIVEDDGVALLERGDSVIIPSIKLADDIAADGVKNYPVDLLWYLHSLKNSATPFEAQNIMFQTVGTTEIVRYPFSTQDGQNMELWVLQRNDDAMAVLDVINPQAIDENEVLQLAQTIRPADAPPPYSLLPMDSTYRLPENVNISYPVNWRPDDEDTTDSFVDLVSVDTRIFLLPFNPQESADNGYSANLTDALLSIVEPLDENVIIRRSDVSEITLPSGLPAVRADYIETNDGFSYERMVLVVGLPDGSVVFAGVVPRFNIVELSEDARSQALAILGTLAN